MSMKATPMIRRLFLWMLLVTAVGFGLKAFLLGPLYIRLDSDVLYQNTWWVDILYYFTDGGLLDLAVFAIVYPITIYAVFYAGLRGSIRLPITFAVLTLLKFAVNFFMTSITDGALPTPEKFVANDLPVILGMVALELVQYVFVVVIAVFVQWRYEARIRVAEGMKLLPVSKRVDYPLPPPPFPFVNLLTWRNPLQRGAFLTALMVLLFRLTMHLVYQITLYNFQGFSDGWLVMLVDLFADLFISVALYLVSLLIMMRLHRRNADHETA